MKNIIDNFENRLSYKLYRTIPEIIHPSISKKNISNYKIVIKDNLIPIRVFYPKMVSNIDNVIIYIHGENNKSFKYGDISRLFAKELQSLIISIDYVEDDKVSKLVKDIYPTCKFIVDEFKTLNINNISICGDSLGANIALEISKLFDNDKDLKLILFYPQIISKAKVRKKNIYNVNIPSLTIIGSADTNYSEILNMYGDTKKENDSHQLLELEFQPHTFLNNITKEEKKVIFNTIEKFIK